MDELVDKLAEDLRALVAEPAARGGRRCSVGLLLEELAVSDAEAAAALQVALDAPSVSHAAIAELLVKRTGRDWKAAAIGHHRRTAGYHCTCPR